MPTQKVRFITTSAISSELAIRNCTSLYAGWRTMLPANINRVPILRESRKRRSSSRSTGCLGSRVIGKPNHDGSDLGVARGRIRPLTSSRAAYRYRKFSRRLSANSSMRSNWDRPRAACMSVAFRLYPMWL